jgi:hypothetical protein
MSRFEPVRVAPEALARTDAFDFADAHLVRLPPGSDRDPAAWAARVFSPAGWPAPLRALMGLRNRIVPLFGIKPDAGKGLVVREVVDGEALIETLDRHLDFRVGVTIGGDVLCLATVVKLHGRLGRLYFLPVRMLHPLLTQSMLRRAARAFR